MQDRTSSLLGAILTTDEELFVHSGFAKASTLLVFDSHIQAPKCLLKRKKKKQTENECFYSKCMVSYLRTVKLRASQSYYCYLQSR